MKTNKMMRIASVLLVAVLLTTCVISGTFAKYVKTADGGDQARVAKWGVGITVTGDMFSKTYDAVDGAATTVVSEDKVVAPGTEGTLAAVTLSGSPEVDVNVAYAAELTLTGWEVDITDDGNDNPTLYCPIVITVDGTEYKIDATNDTLAKLETAVENAIATYTADIDAGTNLATADINSPVVTWAWAIGDANASDTALGDAAANGSASTIALELTVTVTQVGD